MVTCVLILLIYLKYINFTAGYRIWIAFCLFIHSTNESLLYSMLRHAAIFERSEAKEVHRLVRCVALSISTLLATVLAASADQIATN